MKPSVSTDGRSLTIALRLARSMLPSDRIIWVTVGSASGMAAIASETALTNRASQASPRDRPSANITIIVRPAAAAIHSVSVLSSLVSGDCSGCRRRQHPGDLAELGVGAHAGDDHRAAAVRDRRVHERHVRLVPGPEPVLRTATVASLAAGVLSPVNADSSICNELASTIRPSAGNLIARGDEHDVADDELLGRDLRLDARHAAPWRSPSSST